MSIFVLYALIRIIGWHWNHEISYNQNAFIFENNTFMHSSGPIDK